MLILTGLHFFLLFLSIDSGLDQLSNAAESILIMISMRIWMIRSIGASAAAAIAAATEVTNDNEHPLPHPGAGAGMGAGAGVAIKNYVLLVLIHIA